MNSKLTNKDIDETSIYAKEIEKIYDKWGKYIDEGFGSILQWRNTILILATILVLDFFYDFIYIEGISIFIFIILIISVYFYSKKTWYREGFYYGYGAGIEDIHEEYKEFNKKNKNKK